MLTDLEIETYQEPVYRFRVLKCMNDVLRNPEMEWDLVFSSDNLKMAEKVMSQEIESDKKYNFGDLYKIVDNGSATSITRSIY
jgi:hypothetical protein